VAVRREFWISVAVLVVGILLVRYTATGEVEVDRAPLASLPRAIDGLEGGDVPIAPQVLEKLALTDYISRAYRADGRRAVQLYIGFYLSQRTGATYHSPRNCLPGSGWQILEAGTAQVPGPKGGPVTVNEMVIGKGTERMVAIYWYQDRGRVVANEYLAKIYLVWDAATRHRSDGSMVRVLVPTTAFRNDLDEAREEARAFTAALMPLLPAYLPG
jgi:EpsI family protein